MYEEVKELWIKWTKKRYNWNKDFADRQYELYSNGLRDGRLHDVTLCHCHLFFDLFKILCSM